MWFNKKNSLDSSRGNLFVKILIDETEKFVPFLLEMFVTKDHVKSNQNLIGPLKVELLIFVLHYFTKRTVFNRLEEKKIIEILDALNIAIQQNIEPIEYVEFERLYETRNTFFMGFNKLFPDESESPKGTLFWEFGKLICSIYPHKNPVAILGFPIILPELIVNVYNEIKKGS